MRAPQSSSEQSLATDQSPSEAVWVNPGPVTSLQTGPQSPEIEAKVAGLLAQAALEHDPDAAAEIDRLSDAIVGLEKIDNPMRRDNSAYALARKHLVQYYGFDGTSLEQEVLQVILDGMAASPVYRRAIEEDATDEMDLALQAAAVVRDRAILAKEERKELDMQLSPEF